MHRLPTIHTLLNLLKKTNIQFSLVVYEILRSSAFAAYANEIEALKYLLSKLTPNDACLFLTYFKVCLTSNAKFYKKSKNIKQSNSAQQSLNHH